MANKKHWIQDTTTLPLNSKSICAHSTYPQEGGRFKEPFSHSENTERTRSEREGSVAGLCPAERRGRLLRSKCRKAAGRPVYTAEGGSAIALGHPASTLACERASKQSLREGLGQRPIPIEQENLV